MNSTSGAGNRRRGLSFGEADLTDPTDRTDLMGKMNPTRAAHWTLPARLSYSWR